MSRTQPRNTEPIRLLAGLGLGLGKKDQYPGEIKVP